jgi:hypothetical protein
VTGTTTKFKEDTHDDGKIGSHFQIREKGDDKSFLEIDLLVWPKDQKSVCCNIKAQVNILDCDGTFKHAVLIQKKHFFYKIFPSHPEAVIVRSVRTHISRSLVTSTPVMFEVHCEVTIIGPEFGDPSVIKPGPSSLKRFATDFLNDRKADITFLIGKEKRKFRVSKFALSQCSFVFDTMFYGSMPAGETVTLSDMPVPVFITLLRYSYCEEIIIDKKYIVETEVAADKYDIPDLSFAVGLLLDEESTTEVANVITGTSSHTDLQFVLTDWIANQEAAYFVSRAFYQISSAAMVTIILRLGSRPFLTSDQTGKMWTGIMNWVKDQCVQLSYDNPSPAQMKQVLGSNMISNLNKFPFSKMTPEQFVAGPKASGLLEPDVVIDYYHKFYEKATEKDNSFKKMKLS